MDLSVRISLHISWEITSYIYNINIPLINSPGAFWVFDGRMDKSGQCCDHRPFACNDICILNHVNCYTYTRFMTPTYMTGNFGFFNMLAIVLCINLLGILTKHTDILYRYPPLSTLFAITQIHLTFQHLWLLRISWDGHNIRRQLPSPLAAAPWSNNGFFGHFWYKLQLVVPACLQALGSVTGTVSFLLIAWLSEWRSYHMIYVKVTGWWSHFMS